MSDTRIESQLADREALRRVPGLSTELEDITEVEYRQVRLERVVLVGVWTHGSVEDADRSLAELARLAETAGSVVLEGVTQRRSVPDPATYVGSGKARELRDIVQATGAMTLAGGASNDLVLAGGVVLKAGGTLDVNGVALVNGWTLAGESFQGCPIGHDQSAHGCMEFAQHMHDFVGAVCLGK